jgi:hypothetical protein
VDEDLTANIVSLQIAIQNRLAELGYANSPSAEKIGRHLAEISVLTKAFYEKTLPLFISIDPQHLSAITQLLVTMKCDLEEIQDSLVDVESELRDLMTFLQERSPESL